MHVALIGFQHQLLHIELRGVHLHVCQCFIHYQSALFLETHLLHLHVQVTCSTIANPLHFQMGVGRADVAGIESLHTFRQVVIVVETRGIDNDVSEVVNLLC